MPLTRIVLVRHAETKFNSHGMIQGQLDTLLQPGFGPEVDQVADRLALEDGPPSVVYSSDLKRTNITAHRLAGRLRKRHGYRFDHVSTPALRERGQGGLEGKSFGEAYPELDPGQVYGHLFQADDVPNGESLQDVQNRLNHFIADYLPRHNGTGIVVSHLLFGMNYLTNSLTGQGILAGGYTAFSNLSIARLVLEARNYREIG